MPLAIPKTVVNIHPGAKRRTPVLCTCRCPFSPQRPNPCLGAPYLDFEIWAFPSEPPPWAYSGNTSGIRLIGARIATAAKRQHYEEGG